MKKYVLTVGRKSGSQISDHYQVKWILILQKSCLDLYPQIKVLIKEHIKRRNLPAAEEDSPTANF